ncbi:MAG: hypothetical protein EOO06_13530, partial [Chitinophagaceae bacterium]
MNINLDNYEQYLLMYVDNELSATDRLHVEEFLRDYPYLDEELQMLQQTVLPLENLLFDKSSLLKPVLDENTEEKLLMHLDGELPAGESLQIDKKISEHKFLQTEWAQLQKTRLDANDIIEHPDKSSLYRYEGSKVVSGRFVRWAVAAMLIGAGFYFGANLVKKSGSPSTEVATKNPEASKEAFNEGLAEIKDAPREEKIVVAERDNDVARGLDETGSATADSSPASITDKKQVDKPGRTLEQTVSPAPARSAMANNKRKEENSSPVEPKELPQRNIENVLRNDNEVAALQKPSNSIDLPVNIQNGPKNIIDKELTNSTNSYARTASLGFSENSQDQILMMEEENVSRSKAAVFLKKLKRNVERRTNIKPGKS